MDFRREKRCYFERRGDGYTFRLRERCRSSNVGNKESKSIRNDNVSKLPLNNLSRISSLLLRIFDP